MASIVAQTYFSTGETALTAGACGDELLRERGLPDEAVYHFSSLALSPALCLHPHPLILTRARAACSEICAWKDPALGLNLTTTFLGRTLDICVPAQRDTGALLYAQPRPGPCASVRNSIFMAGLGQYECCSVLLLNLISEFLPYFYCCVSFVCTHTRSTLLMLLPTENHRARLRSATLIFACASSRC